MMSPIAMLALVNVVILSAYNYHVLRSSIVEPDLKRHGFAIEELQAAQTNWCHERT